MVTGMAEILSGVDWGPWSLLAAALVAFGVWFQGREKRADARRDRQDEQTQELLKEMNEERRESNRALQDLVRSNTEANQALARSLNGVCDTVESHEQQSATRHGEIVRVLAKD